MMAYRPHNMLVTGGAGFIGSNYVRYMLANDPAIRVINLDKLTYAGSLENIKDLKNNPQHIFVQGDICDRELIDRLLCEYEIDTVVHFAAESHVDNSISGPEIFIQTNVMGTFTLLEACRQYWLEGSALSSHSSVFSSFRFHHISTDEVYGTLEADDPAFSESTPYAPNSPYSACKAGSDHLVPA
ncbi:MAG: GDP-mannose 4,6-dehydratase, partial [Mariprofundaceae bacterium]|nr:GDP-mannose 4,6-dehydratase [Mariprofundaceae bacterium]